MFIRPHHKRQYEQMVDALRGQSVSADNIPQVAENPYRYSKVYLYALYMLWPSPQAEIPSHCGH